MKPRFTPNDANQGDILKELRKIPALDIIDLTEVGDDCPDILLGYQRKNWLVEIKTTTGRVKPGQKRHHREWPGQTAICRSLDDILRLIGLI